MRERLKPYVCLHSWFDIGENQILKILGKNECFVCQTHTMKKSLPLICVRNKVWTKQNAIWEEDKDFKIHCSFTLNNIFLSTAPFKASCLDMKLLTDVKLLMGIILFQWQNRLWNIVILMTSFLIANKWRKKASWKGWFLSQNSGGKHEAKIFDLIVNRTDENFVETT